jgi:FMN phosphatase YigB (HAD superfamily)
VSIHKCLKLLGIEDLMDGVFGTDFHLGTCKPERACFDKVLAEIGMTGREGEVLYFEDSYKNLIRGKEMGMKTCFVNSTTLKEEGRGEDEIGVFDFVVRDIGRDWKEKVGGEGGEE